VIKKWWRWTGTLALLAVLAWRVDWGRLAGAVAGLDGRVWAAAIGLYAVAQLVSGLRWRMLAGVAGFGGTPARYVAYYFIGMFFNLVLPTSVGGDVVRVWYLARQDEGPPEGRTVAAFLSVFAERLNGVLALIALMCVCAVCCPVGLPGWVAASVAGIGAGTALGVASLPLLRRFPVRGARLRRVADAAGVYLRHPRVLLGVTGLSLAVQVLNVVVVWLIGWSLGLQVPALYYGVMVPLVTLLTLLPVSLNGMGVREAGAAVLLGPLGVDETAAVTLYLLSFAVNTLTSLAGAGCYLFGGFPRSAGPWQAPPAHGGPTDDDAVRGDPDQGRAGQPAAAA
jgi:uncharacterized membrane protein YbhN (UPF0104 family)